GHFEADRMADVFAALAAGLFGQRGVPRRLLVPSMDYKFVLSAARPSAAAPRRDRSFEITAALRALRPRVWRRIRVGDCSLDQLHRYLQAVFGWSDHYTYRFMIGDQIYGDVNRRWPGAAVGDAGQLVLSQLEHIFDDEFTLEYEYHCRECWQIELSVRSVPQRMVVPCCTGGQRACPPEAIGGLFGYFDLLEALDDPTGDAKLKQPAFLEGYD